MKKKNNKYNEERAYKNFEIFRESALNNMFYSMQRIDLIIVSLSSGSIIIILNLLKETHSLPICMKVLAFVCIVMYVFAIIINIISQFTAHKLHSKEAEWALQEMDIMNNIRKENEASDSKIWNSLTRIANNLSITFLILGFVLSLILLGTVIF